VGIISAISLVGVFLLSLNKERMRSLLVFLVSLAIGALFGDALLHLIPESFSLLGDGIAAPLLVLVGIILFFVLEKLIRWRHCHAQTPEHYHPVVTMNIVGDALHNFLDGIIIAAAYFASIPLGVATTLAVILHEIPQEIGDFGILVHGGLSTKKALLFNFLSACFAMVGALLFLLVGSHIRGMEIILLPIIAGGFIYIAGSDLVPELNDTHTCDTLSSLSLRQLFFILLGISIMVLLTYVG